MPETVDVLIACAPSVNCGPVQEALATVGTECTLRRARDEGEMIRLCIERTPDLIVAVDSQDTFDAVAILSLSREKSRDTPLIVVSEAAGEEVAVETLKAGATDYIISDRLSRLGPAVTRGLADSRAAREKVAAEAELDLYRQDLERMVKERTEELVRASAALQKETETRIRFLSSMSHELRVPLNSVIGFAGVLLQGLSGPLTDEQRRQVEMISEAGRRLIATIDDVMDVSGIEAGKTEIEWQQFELDTVVSAVAESFSEAAQKVSDTIVLEMPSHPVRIVSDRRKVSKIVQELVDNAVKFTRDGAITLGLEEDGPRLRVVVSDTGVGIPPDGIEDIFDQFQQLELPDGARPEGAGLGLALCRRLAEMLGGLLTVTSAPGTGARFTLTLPVGPVLDVGEGGPQ
jgi:signal transduction histidine kinase